MKLNKYFKVHTPDEIEKAVGIVSGLGYIHKPMVALNEQNKDALLTIFFGTDDSHNLIPLANLIQDKCREYVNIKSGSVNHKKVVSEETLAKNKISAELVALNKQLDEQLPKEIYAAYTSKFNALSAFYPSSEFLTKEGDDVPVPANRASFSHSTVLSNNKKKIEQRCFGYISVTPPASGAVYTYLAETFNNSAFLVHCLRGSSLSAWSKYTNGRSLPVSVNWGLFLLTIGIHPLYKLEHRKNTQKLLSDPLFADIFPNWNDTFDYQLFNTFRKFDLETYQVSSAPKHKETDPVEVRNDFRKMVQEWYKAGNALPKYSTAEKLLTALDTAYQSLEAKPHLWKSIYTIILDMSNQKAFKQALTRDYIEAFSLPHDYSPDLDETIFDLSSAAAFMHLEANPSSNMYTMLRHLADPTNGDIQVITSSTGISPETWIRYEQGTRIPHSAAWTSILISLDIHPIYHIVKRSDPNELMRVFQVYKDLHHILVPKKNEFSLPADSTFEDFMKIVESN